MILASKQHRFTATSHSSSVTVHSRHSRVDRFACSAQPTLLHVVSTLTMSRTLSTTTFPQRRKTTFTASAVPVVQAREGWRSHLSPQQNSHNYSKTGTFAQASVNRSST